MRENLTLHKTSSHRGHQKISKLNVFQISEKKNLQDTCRPFGVFNYVIRRKNLTSCILLAVTLILITLKHRINSNSFDKDASVNYELMFHPFQNYINVQPRSSYLIPNIVHFLRFGQHNLTFVDAVCILAAYRNQQPDAIYFHSTHSNFTGLYWNFLLDVPGFKNIYQIKRVHLPENIFGQLLSRDWHRHHASDVTRIRILMQYGGIFLDNDSYVVRSLDKYRRYEMTLGFENELYLGTQIILAHPDARFLPLWLESYRGHYNPELWYFNAGQYPSTSVLAHFPELVHWVQFKLGVHALASRLYDVYYPRWRNFDAIHLMLNHRFYMNEESYKKYPIFNHTNIFKCRLTFCEMAVQAIYGRYFPWHRQ